MDTEPAEMADVGRPEEARRLAVDHLGLDAIGCSTPNGEPAVVMMVVEKHHKALLALNEEGGSAMAEPFGRLGQDQARSSHVGKRHIDLMRQEPAHSGHTSEGYSAIPA